MRKVWSLPPAAVGFVVLLLFTPVIQGQDGWRVTYSPTKICALKGSTVEINCTYAYLQTKSPVPTVDKTVWFRRENYYEPVDLRTDSQYSGRVEHSCENNICTLRIRDVRDSDSTEYKFSFKTNHQRWRITGSPGVTLSVTDLQVIKPGGYQSYSETKMQCQSSRCIPDQTSYIWYKNGQTLQEETSSSYSSNTDPADSYSCTFKGHEDFHSPSVCVSGITCNKVQYSKRSICAFKGSWVDIFTTYNTYNREAITSAFWFSPERSHQWQSPSQPEDLSKDSQFKGRVHVTTVRGSSTLRISDLRESDSAEYRFKFKASWFEWGNSLPGTTLTVTDLKVLVTSSPSSYRSKLECHSSCTPDPSSYIWYKNGQTFQGQKSFIIVDDTGTTNSYSCSVRGHEDSPSHSVCIKGQTCNRVTYVHRSICAPKGSSVDISCTYNSSKTITSKYWLCPETRKWWWSPSQLLRSDSRVQVLEPERGSSTLRISDLRESDSAEYQFKFLAQWFEWGNSLPGTTLTVTVLQVHVKRVIEHQSYIEAELECHNSCISASRLSYIWFKNGEKLIEEQSFSYRGQFHPGDTISCALKGHDAYCSPSLYALKVPSVSVSPSAEVMENSSVTLTCSSDAEAAANYTWYKRNRDSDPQPFSKESEFVFRSIKSSDSGQYYCTVENELGKTTSENISVDVRYAPRLPSVSVSPSGEIVEGSSVNLTCSSDTNPAAIYTWYKENQTLIQGPKGSFQFTSISSEDRGNYYCKSENPHGQLVSECVFIDVQYAPKLPSVSVSPSGEIVEGSSVTLTCSSDANPAANYTWYKENEDSPKASGKMFTITNFKAEDSGNYYCEAQNKRGRHNSASHLTVLTGAWKSISAVSTTAVFLLIILFTVLLLIRKKKASKQSPEPEERPDYREQYLPTQRQSDDEQNDLNYASVRFYKNQEDSLYSNIGAVQHLRQQEAEDQDVDYTAVQFISNSTAARYQKSAAEDAETLYSTVNKTR